MKTLITELYGPHSSPILFWTKNNFNKIDNVYQFDNNDMTITYNTINNSVMIYNKHTLDTVVLHNPTIENYFLAFEILELQILQTI